MGLFRSRAKKNRENAAAALPEQQTRVPEQQTRVPEQQTRVPEQQTRVPEQQARVPEEPARVTVRAAAAPRETTAEARPDPDRPGWGRSLGQQISKGRDEPASQE
jgi:hypothetical protein